MNVGVVGLNHKTADLALREAMARGASFLPHRLPVVLLSTCNRTELYFGGDDLAEIHSNLLDLLHLYVLEPFAHRLYSHFGTDCLAHLSQVTAGLDSAILAETEIQRQVKLAYARACADCKLPSSLHYAFQKSLQLAKFVRNQVRIEQQTPPLLQAIWQLAMDSLGTLTQRKFLLIGHSDINRRIAPFLLRRGVQDIDLATKNPAAVRLQGCKLSEIAAWPNYECIISATAGDGYLVKGRGRGLHAIFDLSVPRTVDPAVGLQPNIYLHNIEQINEWTQQKQVVQTDQLALSHSLIRQGAARLAASYQRRLDKNVVLT